MAEDKNLEKKMEETAKEENESEISESEAPYGLMSRIIGIFIEPGKAFSRIAEKPEIWGAVLFTFFILLVSSLLTMSKLVDLAVQTTTDMLADKGMPTEAMEKVITWTEWGTKFQSISSLITVVVIWLIFALFVYIVGLIMGQEANYKSSLAIVAYSSLPGVLIKQGILSTAMLISRDWSSASDFQLAVMRGSLSLYTLFGNTDMNAHLQAFLSMIDPFLIWSIILMVIGLKYANRTKMSGAWTTTIIAYILYLAALVPLTAMGISKLNA